MNGYWNVLGGNTAVQSNSCRYCGGFHDGVCPRIKSVEYDQYGTIRKVEFWGTESTSAQEAK